jgi:Protein of unknown function (DUF4232)
MTEPDDDRIRAFLAESMGVPTPPGLENRIISRPTRRRLVIPLVSGGLVVAAALVVVVVGLAAHNKVTAVNPAGSPSPGPSAAPTQSATSRPTQGPTPTTAPSFLPLVGPTCKAADLSLRVGIQGGAGGSGELLLVFTDRGPGPCTLRGTPSVRLLDASGRVLSSPPVDDRPGGMFPTYPNAGVGLVPLSSAGVTGAAGIRGQAELPLQYLDSMCATAIAGVRVTLPTGNLSTSVPPLGGNFPGCFQPSVSVNPFQPAEYVG